MNSYTDWKHDKADIFWGDLASSEHVVQIYENEGVLIDTLAGFVDTGINIGDCCIIIATAAHLEALNKRLESYGLSVESLIADDGYMPFVAEEIVAEIMVDGRLNVEAVIRVGTRMMAKSRKSNRQVRMFGETSALLWADGHIEAAMQLEQIANMRGPDEKTCIYCAYPKSVFTQMKDNKTSLHHVCAEHAKVISGTEKQVTEIYYRE